MDGILTELNYRNNNGIEVFLLWNRETGLVYISVSDAATESESTIAVAPEKASDAFSHPYAYLASPATASYPVAA